MTRCKIVGHNWDHVFVCGYYGNIKIKFVACYCQWCNKGHDELLDAINKMTKQVYGTHSEKYFDRDD